MMMPSNFIIFKLSMIVLLMSAFATAINTPQPTAMLSEISQSYDDEQNPAVVLPDHQINNLSTDDDSLSDEEYDNDYSQVHQHKGFWPQFNKRYATKINLGGNSNGNGGDSRVSPLPYRFGKRAAMPYRFGKRAGMHYRLGKKSGSL